jgi:hypothetical protein
MVKVGRVQQAWEAHLPVGQAGPITGNQDSDRTGLDSSSGSPRLDSSVGRVLPAEVAHQASPSTGYQWTQRPETGWSNQIRLGQQPLISPRY